MENSPNEKSYDHASESGNVKYSADGRRSQLRHQKGAKYDKKLSNVNYSGPNNRTPADYAISSLVRESLENDARLQPKDDTGSMAEKQHQDINESEQDAKTEIVEQSSEILNLGIDSEASVVPFDERLHAQNTIVNDPDRGNFAIISPFNLKGGDKMCAEVSEYIRGELEDQLNLIHKTNSEDGQFEIYDIFGHLQQRITELKKEYPNYEDTGASLCVVKVVKEEDGKRWAVVANIGDTRVSLVSPDGKLRELVLPDNPFKQAIAKGIYKEGDKLDSSIAEEKIDNYVNAGDQGLTPEELEYFKSRHQKTTYLGNTDTFHIDIQTVELQDGERIVLMSPGIDNLTRNEKEEILSQNSTGDLAEKLSQEAHDLTNKKSTRYFPEDASAVIIEIKNMRESNESQQPEPVESKGSNTNGSEDEINPVKGNFVNKVDLNSKEPGGESARLEGGTTRVVLEKEPTPQSNNEEKQEDADSRARENELRLREQNLTDRERYFENRQNNAFRREELRSNALDTAESAVNRREQDLVAREKAFKEVQDNALSAMLLEIENLKCKVDELRASKQGNGPELAPIEPGSIEVVLSAPETQKSLWDKGSELVKKIDFLSLGVGAGAGAATRIGLRTALGAKTLGATLAIGAGAGAVSGGVREWVKQLRFGNYSESFKENLVNLKEAKSIELSQQKVKIQKALEEEQKIGYGLNNTGSTAKIDEYRQQIATIDRVLEFKVEQNGSKPKVKDLKRFLEVDFNKAQELIGGQKSPEFQKLSAELKENRWKKGKIGKAILKGAIFGAVGAGMANSVMDFAGAHGWLPAGIGGGEAAGHVAENGISHEMINNCIAGQVVDKGAGASEHILSEARAHLAEHSFGIHIQHGDGATQIARRAIHDYLVNEKHLEGVHFKEPNLAELVNAEDTLRREIEQHVGSVIPGSQIGSVVEVHGQSIEKVLQHAMGLHENQIDHVNSILAEPAHHISEANQNLMTHHDSLWSGANGPESQNDFYTGSEHSAAEASAQAIKNCAENPTTATNIINSIAHNGSVQRIDGAISSAAQEANGAKGKIFAGFLAGGILGTLFGSSRRRSNEVAKPPVPEKPKQTVRVKVAASENNVQATEATSANKAQVQENNLQSNAEKADNIIERAANGQLSSSELIALREFLKLEE